MMDWRVLFGWHTSRGVTRKALYPTLHAVVTALRVQQRERARGPLEPVHWAPGTYDIDRWLDHIEESLRATGAGVAFHSLTELLEEFTFDPAAPMRTQLNECASLLGMPSIRFAVAPAGGPQATGKRSQF